MSVPSVDGLLQASKETTPAGVRSSSRGAPGPGGGLTLHVRRTTSRQAFDRCHPNLRAHIHFELSCLMVPSASLNSITLGLEPRDLSLEPQAYPPSPVVVGPRRNHPVAAFADRPVSPCGPLRGGHSSRSTRGLPARLVPLSTVLSHRSCDALLFTRMVTWTHLDTFSG